MLFLNICLVFSVASVCINAIEEFSIRNPMELHDAAVKFYIKERERDPANKDMGTDSPVMKRARQHAVKRFSAVPEEELTLQRVGLSGSQAGNEQLLQLPAPVGAESLLASAVTSHGTGSEIMGIEEISALSVAINEDIGMGAISRAGALPFGEDMAWVKFVDDKMKRDAQLDHQTLLWELGSEMVEQDQTNRGGLNITEEERLLSDMTEWFQKGGGTLKYVKPSLNKDSGYTLLATEDIAEGETVVQVPIKLTLCRISARNVLLPKKGKYLGEELKKTFEKNEVWALSVFLLHEWYKETAGKGSKWGPYLRLLRMRSLSTPVLQALKSTSAVDLSKQWFKSANDLKFFSSNIDGPCSPTSDICNTKPLDKFGGNNRFEAHQLRWAYWVVKQNAVRVRHTSTGHDFLALVPFFDMTEKRISASGTDGVTFNMDGTISLHTSSMEEDGEAVGVHPGNFTDTEFFMRYMSAPKDENPYNHIRVSLPGTAPSDSTYHQCLKMAEKEHRKKCRGERGSDLQWKIKTLSDWRKQMNLPPRMGELRMWATRLHLYGDDEEEQKKMSANNQLLAGLPLSTDEVSAEEQLMLLGMASTNEEAHKMVMIGQKERPPPQLYTAPDPDEDPEAQKAMEHLATLAAQLHTVVSSGNIVLNATRAVLNKTRDFFQNGVLPQGGLDELDDFLLKKIGMLSHCGFDNEMKILNGTITKELVCAMRVHLMNESEIHVFCPADAKVFHENCQNVEFMNYTAISESNELLVIQSFRATLRNILSAYPSTVEEDEAFLRDHPLGSAEGGVIMHHAIRLRLREKELILNTLAYLDDQEIAAKNGSTVYQLDLKRLEREEADRREAAHQAFVEEIRRRAAEKVPLAVVPVDMGNNSPKLNLTLLEGQDVKETVLNFCRMNNVGKNYVATLEKELRARVVSPRPPQLLMGIVVPLGDRRVLAIPEGSNATIETGVFCAKYNITETRDCDRIQERVKQRLIPETFSRRILLSFNVDAPDSRKLALTVREGEQHEVRQFVSDFLENYKMLHENALNVLTSEVLKRLPAPALQIPVSLNSQRKVQIRFAENENITAVVSGFINFFELDQSVALQITRMARYGMAPGTFLV